MPSLFSIQTHRLEVLVFFINTHIVNNNLLYPFTIHIIKKKCANITVIYIYVIQIGAAVEWITYSLVDECDEALIKFITMRSFNCYIDIHTVYSFTVLKREISENQPIGYMYTQELARNHTNLLPFFLFKIKHI